jgi:hypothetical protein
MPDLDQPIFALEHLETHRLICALNDGEDYLVCFTDREDAIELRRSMGLDEHCTICCMPLRDYPIKHFWLDGQFFDMSVSLTPADV